jgi:hypothetical protein
LSRSIQARAGEPAARPVGGDHLPSTPDVRECIDIRNNTVTGNDINEGSLGQVPSASSANTANSAKRPAGG